MVIYLRKIKENMKNFKSFIRNLLVFVFILSGISCLAAVGGGPVSSGSSSGGIRQTNFPMSAITNWNTSNTYFGSFIGDASGATNLIVPAVVTNIQSVTWRDGNYTQLAFLRGGGASTNDVRAAQPIGNQAGWFMHSGGYTWLSSPFTAASSFAMAKVIVRLNKNDPAITGTIQLDLYAASNYIPVGSPIASSATVDWSTIAYNADFTSYVDVIFSISANITNTGNYAMVLHCPTFSPTYPYTYVRTLAVANGYTSGDGVSWANNGVAFYFTAATSGSVATPNQLSFFSNNAETSGLTNMIFGPVDYTSAAISLTAGAIPNITLQNATNGPANLVVKGSITSSESTIVGSVSTATPAFKSTGTNNMILRCNNGGSFILRVDNTGTITAVTNSTGL